MFEEEYAAAIRKPKYQTLFEGVDLETAAEGVHDGYFAIDKKKDSAVTNGSRSPEVRARRKPTKVPISSSCGTKRSC